MSETTTLEKNGADKAADLVKSTYDRAAEKLPDAVAGAQTAARNTQSAIDGVPDQGLIIGTSFSAGLGVALFLNGANRLLVLLAIAPAVALAAAFLSRSQQIVKKR